MLLGSRLDKDAQDLAQFFEDHDTATKIIDRSRASRAGVKLLGVGEAIESGQQFEQDADRPTGVEVLVHVFQKSVPQARNLALEWRRPLCFGHRLADRWRRKCEKTLLGDP